MEERKLIEELADMIRNERVLSNHKREVEKEILKISNKICLETEEEKKRELQEEKEEGEKLYIKLGCRVFDLNKKIRDYSRLLKRVLDKNIY